MKDQQPLYKQFFEEYAKLLRIHLHHYHHKHGGQAKFLNALIITPSFDDSYHVEINFACQQVNSLNEWLAQNTPFGAELTYVSLDDELNICYQFFLFTEQESPALEKVEYTHFCLSHNTYEGDWDHEGDMQYFQISDEVWGEMLQEVKSVMSFGTLCITEAS